MQIEKGRFYRSAGGRVFGPMVRMNEPVGVFVWMHPHGAERWREDGKNLGEDLASTFDLIEDATVVQGGSISVPESLGWAELSDTAPKICAGYEPLASVLQAALDQAQSGKGKERHANDREFERQPIMEIGRMVGLGYPTGQAQKKTQEAVGMFNRGQTDSAEAELLGAINYLAAAILLIREL